MDIILFFKCIKGKTDLAQVGSNRLVHCTCSRKIDKMLTLVYCA